MPSLWYFTQFHFTRLPRWCNSNNALLWSHSFFFSNWTTLFSQVTKVTLIRQLYGAWIEPQSQWWKMCALPAWHQRPEKLIFLLLVAWGSPLPPQAPCSWLFPSHKDFYCWRWSKMWHKINCSNTVARKHIRVIRATRCNAVLLIASWVAGFSISS